MLEKAKGAQVRPRSVWVEEGERNTSYFLRLEKERQTYNKIDSLTTDTGVSVTSDQDILKKASQFYETLYTSQTPSGEHIDNYLANTQFKDVLSKEDRDLCEGLVTEQELDNAIQNMHTGKSPGLDGLSRYLLMYIINLLE